MGKCYGLRFNGTSGMLNKIGIFSCLHEYMKLCEYKRPSTFFDFCPRTLIGCQFHTFPQKPLGQL